MQGAQFVYYAPKRPNVALFVVFLVVNLLRRHVVRGANVREGELRLVVEPGDVRAVQQIALALNSTHADVLLLGVVADLADLVLELSDARSDLPLARVDLRTSLHHKLIKILQ